MGSEFKNKWVVRSLADALGLLGQKMGPSVLATDRVVLVAGLEIAWSQYVPFQTTQSYLIAGSGSLSIPLVSNSPQTGIWNPGGPTLLLPNNARANVGVETVILGYRLEITYTAAGALADNTRTWNVSHVRSIGNSGVYIPLDYFQPIATVASATLAYFFSFPSIRTNNATQQATQNSVWVPNNTDFGLVVGRDSGLIPADTNINVITFGLQSPKGFPPPGLK